MTVNLVKDLGLHVVWTAGSNIPGYLPEGDIAVFALQVHAREYIAAEISDHADNMADWEDGDESFADSAMGMSGLIKGDPEQDFRDEFSVQIETGLALPTAYWVKRSTLAEVYGERLADAVAAGYVWDCTDDVIRDMEENTLS
jgi:hypothetical protein